MPNLVSAITSDFLHRFTHNLPWTSSNMNDLDLHLTYCFKSQWMEIVPIPTCCKLHANNDTCIPKTLGRRGTLDPSGQLVYVWRMFDALVMTLRRGPVCLSPSLTTNWSVWARHGSCSGKHWNGLISSSVYINDTVKFFLTFTDIGATRITDRLFRCFLCSDYWSYCCTFTGMSSLKTRKRQLQYWLYWIHPTHGHTKFQFIIQLIVNNFNFIK